MNYRLRQFKWIDLRVMSTLIMGLNANFALCASWENQAQRLQVVSASLLDAQPLLSPKVEDLSTNSFRIEGKAIVSILPKMNATVGGKTEQPPQPPAHSIPTLEVSYHSPEVGHSVGLVRTWAGFLPESAAKSTGMKAKAKQTIWGYSLGIKFMSSPILASSIEVGEQVNSTLVSGGITDPEASDEFDVRTKIRFATLTLSPKAFDKVWFQAQIAERTVALRFDIPADGTTFNLNDRSSVADGSASTQFSVGYHIKGGIQAAIGVINVPQRVTMPRLLVSYSHSIGTTSIADRFSQR